MSYLIINEMALGLTAMKTCYSTNIQSLPEYFQFQPQTQTPKRFTINVSKDAKNWKFGILYISGIYSTHKGKMRKIAWIFHITPYRDVEMYYTGRTDEKGIWKKVKNKYKKKQIPNIKYRKVIEEMEKDIICYLQEEKDRRINITDIDEAIKTINWKSEFL